MLRCTIPLSSPALFCWEREPERGAPACRLGHGRGKFHLAPLYNWDEVKLVTPNTVPTSRGQPLKKSAAAICWPPSRWTIFNRSDCSPHATIIPDSSAAMTWPFCPSFSASSASQIFKRGSSVVGISVKAPGHGVKARMRRCSTDAGSPQSIRPSAFFTFRAYVAP